MPWVAPVMAVISAGATLAGVAISMEAASDAKKQAAAENEKARLENERAKSLQLEENAKILASARAKAAASGTSGVSEAIFLADLKKKSLEELDWLGTVGAANLQTTAFSGKAAVSQAQSQVVSSFGKFANAGANAYTAFNPAP